MSFIATANPPPATPQAKITNDGWFPDIDLDGVRAACLLDGSVTNERLKQALQDSMLSVNDELKTWADEQRVRWGYASLADVPAPQVGGESAKVLHYHRAVQAGLQADLLETYRGMAAIGIGNKLDRSDDNLQHNASNHRRNQNWAISALQGRARAPIDSL